MTFFFDLTPFVVLIVIVGGFAIYLVLSFVGSLIWRLVHYPFKHKTTGLRLYEFERQAYNNRVVDHVWLKTDRQARVHQSRNDFYSFCTKEIYPNYRYLDEIYIESSEDLA